MAIKLTPESFLNVVKQSNLVTGDVLHRVMAELKAEGVEVDTSRAIADQLVERNLLTRWQADKLLQGKHKGFFLGKYRLLRLLGKGGMSSVYLAEHVLMRRQCAIKVLPTKRVNDTSYLGRFHREAQAVASLDHPNIIKAFDVDKEMEKDTEIHFLVMEFVDGRSLQETVQQDGPLSFQKAADYIRQSADGLAHAHEAGMVHRDIKPGNLLVDQNETVKLLDMGLARFFHEGEEESLTVAHDEKVLGTADYLAPEQALDSHSVDARADIYSLGCTFYFLLTGHPPFTEGTLAQRLMNHQTKKPPPVTDERPDIPKGLLAILEKMMEKQPEERYQTAAEVASNLAEWLVENGSEEWHQANPGLSGKRSARSPGNGPLVARPVVPVAKAVSTEDDTAYLEHKTIAPSPVETVAEAGNELNDFLANLGKDEPKSGKQSGKKKDSSIKKKAEEVPPVATPVETNTDKSKRRAQPAATAKPVTAQPTTGNARRTVKPAVPVAGPVVAESTGASPEIENEFAIDTAPAGVAPTVVKSPSKQLDAVKKDASGWKDRLKDKRLLAALGGVVLLLGGFGIYSVLTGPGGGTDPDEITEPDEKDAAPKPEIGKPILVGAKGHFTTIKAALDFINEEFDDFNATEPQVIKLAAGEVFKERLTLDNSFGSQNKSLSKIRITTDASKPAILKPSGSEPVISVIDGVVDVQIENLHVDASGKDLAVHAQGSLEKSKLSNLKITGFGKIGVAGDSVFGGSQLGGAKQAFVIENLLLQGASGNATGIQLNDEHALSDSEHIAIRDCRFLGPMQAGIEIKTGSDGNDSVKNLEIIGNIFASDGTGAGIRFHGNPSLQQLIIACNTFYKLNQGIVFGEAPSKLSAVSIERNLFAEIKAQEAVLLKGDAAKFPKGLVIRDNATSGDKTKPGDKREIKLFNDKSSKAGLKIEFVSEEPADPKYLSPKSGALLPKVDNPTIKLGPVTYQAKPHVGAVKP